MQHGAGPGNNRAEEREENEEGGKNITMDQSNVESSQHPPDSGTETHDVSKIDWGKELRANENWLRTVIAARVGEAAAVDEVWQEVSMAAFLQKAPLQDASKVSPWLYRIAVTQSLMYRRKMGRRRKLLDRYVDRFQPSESDNRESNPLEWMLTEERRAMVRDALTRIPIRDKETLMLKYVHNWSYKEIAEKLGSTVPAVQAKLHRARKKLRDEINLLQKTAESP